MNETEYENKTPISLTTCDASILQPCNLKGVGVGDWFALGFWNFFFIAGFFFSYIANLRLHMDEYFNFVEKHSDTVLQSVPYADPNSIS